jgi:hypothetical protein
MYIEAIIDIARPNQRDRENIRAFMNQLWQYETDIV